MTFGTGWTAALLGECAKTRGPGGGPVLAPWPLTVFGLETGGTFDTTILQGGARLVAPGPLDDDGFPDQRPEVYGTAALRLSHGTGARGLWQKMPRRVVRSEPSNADPKRRKKIPDLVYLYDVLDPIEQMREGFAFWRAMMRSFNVGEIRSIEAFYCLNFAPARLLDGKYDDLTRIYANDASYRANAWLDKRKDARDPALIANGVIELIELRGALVEAQGGRRYLEEVKMADEMVRKGTTISPSPLEGSWKDIQGELTRQGYYDGAIDGLLGPKTRMAIWAALTAAKAALPAGGPSE